MIKIKCVKKPEVSYTLLGGVKYHVGRKSGEITFPDDQSISRNHADVEINHPIGNIVNPSLTPVVIITDSGSKFGTFAKEGIELKNQLPAREGMTLTNGDKFRFGLQWNEFQIFYTPLITTTSTLKDAETLKTAICKLGGHVVQEWIDGCDYVIMDNLTLTIKAVCALLSAKYIVTPAYFWDYLKAVEAIKEPPKPLDYIPPLAENQLASNQVSFRPDESRTRLFEGKTFLFANQKHQKKLGVAIECGGGQCKIYSDIRSSDLTGRNVLLIPPVADLKLLDAESQRIIGIYTSANKRVIQESEIGLAAVYNSIEKHCNPFHSFTGSLFPSSLASQTQPKKAVDFVGETQSIDDSISGSGINMVEESFAIPTNPSSRVKAEIDIDEDYGATRSKRRLTRESESVSPATKRTRSQASDASSKENDDLLSSIFNMDDSQENMEEDSAPAPTRTTRNSASATPTKTSTQKSEVSETSTTNGTAESNKRKQSDGEDDDVKEGIIKKPKVEEEPKETAMEAAQRLILERAKKLNIEPKPVVKVEEVVKVELKPLEATFAPLMRPPVQPTAEVFENGSLVKNFKKFAKIQPNSSFNGSVSAAENIQPRRILFSEDSFESCFAGPLNRQNGPAMQNGPSKVKLPKRLRENGVDGNEVNGENDGNNGDVQEMFDLSTDHIDHQEQQRALNQSINPEAGGMVNEPLNTFEEILHPTNQPNPNQADFNVNVIPPANITNELIDEWSFNI